MQGFLHGRLALTLVGVYLLMGCPTVSAQDLERFATVGEGYTAGPSEGMRIGWRMFTAAEIPTVCASTAARRADRLVAQRQQIQLSVGEPFSFGDANVMAVDRAGLPLGPVPILLELDEGPQPLLNLETCKMTGKDIRAIRPGTFWIRIRTICGGVEGSEPEEPEILIQYTVNGKVSPQ